MFFTYFSIGFSFTLWVTKQESVSQLFSPRQEQQVNSKNKYLKVSTSFILQASSAQPRPISFEHLLFVSMILSTFSTFIYFVLIINTKIQEVGPFEKYFLCGPLLNFFLNLLCFPFLAMRHVGSQLPNQGSGWHLLHWKRKSKPLDHQGSGS